jgi:hypothetical protein
MFKKYVHQTFNDKSTLLLATVMPRDCVNSAVNFCYICGEVTLAREIKAITAIVKKAYHLCFGCKIGDQDKSWAPHIWCRKCATNLSQWLNGKRHVMPFAVPLVWREPSNHATDCYLCMVPPVSGGITKKKKCTIVYPNIPLLSVQFRTAKEFPFPNLRKNLPSIQTTRTKASRPRGYPEPPVSTAPHVSHGRSSAPQPRIITRDELSDLVRDLELSKTKAELLGSRLKQ